jgi:hypothetical protein
MLKMRNLLLILTVALVAGCAGAPAQMPAPTAIKGKVELSGGKPASGLVLNLIPLEGQHPGVFEVAEDGSFKGDAITGKYTYFVAKGSAKNSEQTLKLVNAKLYEADANRNIVVKAGEDIKITLE